MIILSHYRLYPSGRNLANSRDFSKQSQISPGPNEKCTFVSIQQKPHKKSVELYAKSHVCIYADRFTQQRKCCELSVWQQSKKDVKRERSDNQTGCKQTTMFSRVI